jgi:hypothetical protein
MRIKPFREKTVFDMEYFLRVFLVHGFSGDIPDVTAAVRY